MIKYESENGYTGILYGESSLSVFDSNGKERLHTGSRNINTLEELKHVVEAFPDFIEKLEGNLDDIMKGENV